MNTTILKLVFSKITDKITGECIKTFVAIYLGYIMNLLFLNSSVNVQKSKILITIEVHVLCEKLTICV